MSTAVLKQVLMSKTAFDWRRAVDPVKQFGRKALNIGKKPLPAKVWAPVLGGAGLGAAGLIGHEAGKTEKTFKDVSEQRQRAVKAKEKAEAGPQSAGDWWEFAKQHPYVTGGAVAAPIAAYVLWKLLSKKDEEEEPRARMY